MGPGRPYLQIFTVLTVSCLFSISKSARPEVRGKVGSVVELECSVSPPDSDSASLHVVEWVRQGMDVPVLIKFGSYPRVHPQYEGRVSLVRITVLRVEDLQLEDQGLYDCRILILDKPTDELHNGTWTLLSVTAPPTIIKAPPPVMESLVGRDISLACVANGNPAPTITWLKDGSVIEGNNYEGGTLSLRVVTMASAGQYICYASNSEGNVTRETKLKLKGPPIIVVPPKNTSLNMSQNALLQCQAVADPPNMTYVWQKGGENVYHVESLKSRVKIMVDGTLLISSLLPEDSGNYTCMPTNGLLTPPTASAKLTVMHPAQALRMPKETYLPTGMAGLVTCPVTAQPPLLRVDWTKDGKPLDLALHPGWTLTSEGSLFMATVNDDAAGVYTCTPYNSYGSMGSSQPTTVILQDPPTFRITPEKEYKQEVGGTLIIPCKGNEDPTITVSWSKVESARRSSYSIAANGSLLLQPLSKDHQGEWECTAANRVALVKASTHVFVLGTSPHAASSLSIFPGVTQANISWEAGFDGGSAQTFSVWMKKISVTDDDDGKRDWFSVSVPPLSGTTMLVTGLTPATHYQFSVLSHNIAGTGPFSEIATIWTLDPPPRGSKLMPPASLSANLSSAGVVLQWSLSEPQHPPITGFLLQSRTDQGEWLNLEESISASSSEIVVPGLHKDCAYELRLLSRRGELLSEPSPSVNVSTMGMEMYPATSRLLESVPQPLLAGVLGGVAVMCLALVLLLGSACVISLRRDRRRRKKKELPSAIYKCSPSIRTSDTSSPDSLLKKSLLHAQTLYPTSSSSSTTTTTSSSSQTDCSSLSKGSHTEHQHQRKHLPASYSRGHLTRTVSTPISPSLELISRGPDGRFTLQSCDRDTDIVHEKRNLKNDVSKPTSFRRSLSLHSEREDRKEPPFVLSVDLSPCKSAKAYSPSPNFSMAEQLPHLRHYSLNRKVDYEGYPDLSSLCTESIRSVTTMSHLESPTFPVLKRLSQPSTTASTLVLQMEHEREKGNLSRCLKLAQEREELERELQRYTLDQGAVRDMRREMPDMELKECKRREINDKELVWKCKSSTLPLRYPQGNKGSYGLSQSPLSSSSIQWEAHPLVSPTTLNPASTLQPESRSWCNLSNQHHIPSFTKQTPLLAEEANGFCKDRLTLPHLSSKHHRHERVEAALEGYNNRPQSTVLELQMNDSRSKAWRQNSLCHDSPSVLSCQTNEYTEISHLAADAVTGSSKEERPFHKPSNTQNEESMCAEMSVDGPELEVCIMQPTKKPMLHHRIASHVQEGRSLRHKDEYKEMRSRSLNSHSPAAESDVERIPSFLQPSETKLWKTRNQSSKIWDSKQRSQSLDSRRQKQIRFLTPDAWIESLSQENCSLSTQPDSLIWGPHDTMKISKCPSKSPPDTKSSRPQHRDQTPHDSHPTMDSSSPEDLIPKPDVPCHYEPQREVSRLPNASNWPITSQEARGLVQSIEAAKEAPRCSLPDEDDSKHNVQDTEGENGGVSESGSNYSSYASSGRGSLEPANGRLSLCMSPTLNNSPETVEESQEGTEDTHVQKILASQRRKPSIDENYEWDAAEVCSQPGDHDGLPPLLDLQKPAFNRSTPSMQCTATALKNYNRLSLHPRHESSCFSEQKPDSVLF
ncbi:hypothetical protein LDENG_00034970 [Lucifuga dentata]|nr:hypothetical protein LDENG_00034970 [Lucifuga dentata]